MTGQAFALWRISIGAEARAWHAARMSRIVRSESLLRMSAGLRNILIHTKRRLLAQKGECAPSVRLPFFRQGFRMGRREKEEYAHESRRPREIAPWRRFRWLGGDCASPGYRRNYPRK